MRALSEIRKAAFIRRLLQFMQDEIHRAPEEAALARLLERGLAYGLVSEQQLAGYISLAWQAGVRPPASDPEWIAEVMSDPYRLPDGKVETIFDRATSRLAA